MLWIPPKLARRVPLLSHVLVVCFLACRVAKMYLGWLMLVNVIMTEGLAEDALGSGALEQAR